MTKPKPTAEEKEAQRRMVCDYIYHSLYQYKPAVVIVGSEEERDAMKAAILDTFNGAWPINCRLHLTQQGVSDDDGPIVPRPA